MKDAEVRATEDRRLRDRVQHESSDMVQDNTILSNRVEELERQLARVSHSARNTQTRMN